MPLLIEVREHVTSLGVIVMEHEGTLYWATDEAVGCGDPSCCDDYLFEDLKGADFKELPDLPTLFKHLVKIYSENDKGYADWEEWNGQSDEPHPLAVRIRKEFVKWLADNDIQLANEELLGELK